jgi:hypothetical protein
VNRFPQEILTVTPKILSADRNKTVRQRITLMSAPAGGASIAVGAETIQAFSCAPRSFL